MTHHLVLSRQLYVTSSIIDHIKLPMLSVEAYVAGSFGHDIYKETECLKIKVKQLATAVLVVDRTLGRGSVR